MGPSSRLCASLDVALSPLCARNKMPGPPFEVIKEHTTSHSKHHESKHTKQTQITVGLLTTLLKAPQWYYVTDKPT